MLDYTLIAGVLLYMLVTKLRINFTIPPIVSAVIVVLGYFIITTTIKFIIFAGKDVPLLQFVGISQVVLIFLQTVILSICYKMMDDADDSYGKWFAWGIFGFIGMFFLAPFIISLVPFN